MMSIDTERSGAPGPEDGSRPKGEVLRPEDVIGRSQPSADELLFGQLAIVTGIIDQECFDRSLHQKGIGQGDSLANILVECDAITKHERRVIDDLCQVHQSRHDDDPTKSLAALSMLWPVAVAKKSQALCGGYVVLGEIARGGMGVVYMARQTKLHRLVALKMIRSGELADAEQIRRFYAEAAAAAKLDHAGIVPIYEVGEANGQHFYSTTRQVAKADPGSAVPGPPRGPREAWMSVPCA